MQPKHTRDKSGKPPKSIRKRLARTVLIPSLVLLVLCAALATYLVINGLYVRTVAVSVREVSIPAAGTLANIQKERQIALQFLDAPARGQTGLQTQQKATDEKLTALQAAFAETISDSNTPDEIAGKVKALSGQFEQLPAVRSQVGVRSIGRAQVNDYYNGLLDAAATLFDVQARIVPDAAAAHGGITATAVFRSADMMSRGASLVSTAFAGRAFVADDFVRFTELRGFYHTQLTNIAPFLDPEVRGKFEALTASAPWRQLTSAEDAFVRRGPWRGNEVNSVPVTEADWQSAAEQVAQRLTEIAIDQADKVSAAAIRSGDDQLRNAIIVGVIALLVSIGAMFFAMRVSRSLVDHAVMTRLAQLRDDALDLARNRLPDIVSRVREGDSVDVNAALPRLDHGEDEIGQVAEAFNAAQVTAVNAAASEAKARSGLHNVFLGIAQRSQVLVLRQLALLDQMQQREDDSTQLGLLFELDHLATRARRTTENLIILGGKRPGRRWRDPVPLMDILRSAVSEIEQYKRVHVDQAPDVAVVGTAVADIIHLIAELVDNATTFSPPTSPVEMTGTLVARGVMIDVTDHGRGMTEDRLRWANGMMATPPEFDAMALNADSMLGLFVVSRVSATLGITVTFGRSRSGGLRATVLIPTRLLPGHQAADDNADAAPHRRTAVLPQVVAPASVALAVDTSVFPSHTSTPVDGAQAQVTPETRKPKPYPERVRTSHDSVPGTPPAGASPAATDAELPALPQRRPQQNLVAQLRDEPGNDAVANATAEGRTASSLTALSNGTRRARIEGTDA